MLRGLWSLLNRTLTFELLWLGWPCVVPWVPAIILNLITLIWITRSIIDWVDWFKFCTPSYTHRSADCVAVANFTHYLLARWGSCGLSWMFPFSNGTSPLWICIRFDRFFLSATSYLLLCCFIAPTHKILHAETTITCGTSTSWHTSDLCCCTLLLRDKWRLGHLTVHHSEWVVSLAASIWWIYSVIGWSPGIIHLWDTASLTLIASLRLPPRLLRAGNLLNLSGGHCLLPLLSILMCSLSSLDERLEFLIVHIKWSKRLLLLLAGLPKEYLDEGLIVPF